MAFFFPLAYLLLCNFNLTYLHAEVALVLFTSSLSKQTKLHRKFVTTYAKADLHHYFPCSFLLCYISVSRL